MKPPESDQPLRELLAAWKDVPAPDPRLAGRVCRAADQAGPAERQPSFWRNARSLIAADATWFRFACAGIVAGALLGIGSAEWRRGRDVAQAPARYLNWIAPPAPAGVMPERP